MKMKTYVVQFIDYYLCLFIREKNKTIHGLDRGGAKKLFNEINEIITYRRKNLHGGDEDSSF